MMNFELSLPTVMKSILCPSHCTVREVHALYTVWTWEAGASWLSSLAALFLKFSEKNSFIFSVLFCICRSFHLYHEKYELLCGEISLHWMKHKAIQYFHTIYVQICCCFIVETLVHEQGNQTELCPLQSLIFSKGRSWEGGRCKRSKGVAAELYSLWEGDGGDRQMAVDKCC